MKYQPRGLSVELFEHQSKSFRKMKEIEREMSYMTGSGNIHSKIGFLCSPPGSGKNVTMLSVISDDITDWDISTSPLYTVENVDILNNGLISLTDIQKFEKLDKTLIVANKLFIKQWKDEIEKYTKKTVYVASKISTSFNILDIMEKDIVLVPSGNIYSKFTLLFSSYAWKRMVIDIPPFEFNSITCMKHMHSRFCWILTDNLSTMISKYIKYKRTDNFVSQIIKDVWKNEEFIKGFSVCDSDDTVKKYVTTEHLYTYTKDSTDSIDYMLNNIQVQKGLDIKDNTCTICLNQCVLPIVHVSCNNAFCAECLHSWIVRAKTCPNCRNTADFNTLRLIDYVRKETSEETVCNILFSIIEKALNSDINSRILLCYEDMSQYSLNRLCTQLKSKNINFTFDNVINDKNTVFFTEIGTYLTLQDISDLIVFSDSQYLLKKVKSCNRTKNINIHKIKEQIHII